MLKEMMLLRHSHCLTLSTPEWDTVPGWRLAYSTLIQLQVKGYRVQ